jgi:hypothetical protein
MNGISIDSLYVGFVDSLPPALRPLARRLPQALRLAPVEDARWRDVFKHEVTLGAPWLIAEGFPTATDGRARAATLAHALAIIEAFGSDRVADGQVARDPQLLCLLEHIRFARNRALATVHYGNDREMWAADKTTHAAILEERSVLASGTPVDFVEYGRISLGKQAVGFPASRALARAVAAPADTLQEIDRTLEGVWLGLQFEDDVFDWEDDFRVGGAWAVCLAAHCGFAVRQGAELEAVREAVFESGVLCLMLERARDCYRAATQAARRLGAHRLAEWSRAREEHVARLVKLESEHAGYAVRMRKLSPWAMEVLA